MQDSIPIRELSRVTGVNTVTLRAWERRYGLLKPQRTQKGHRLYSRADIKLVQNIQTWLGRGLAIGKVSELLESDQATSQISMSNQWQDYADELLAIMANLNMGKFNAFFNQLFAVYPAALVADQLIIPVQMHFSTPAFGNSLKHSILSHSLSEYLLMLTQRQRQQAIAKHVAIIQLQTPMNLLRNCLLHYSISSLQINSELIGLVDEAELVLAVQQLQLDAIIVYNDTCASLSDYQKSLSALASRLSIPLLVVGELTPALKVESTSALLVADESVMQSAIALVAQTLMPTEVI